MGDVWAIEFQFDQTSCGRPLKLLNIVDEFSRQALAIRVSRRIDADALVSVLNQLARPMADQRTYGWTTVQN